MMDFGRWMAQQGQQTAQAPEAELPEGVRESGGVYVARCRACEAEYELPCDLDEYDPKFSFCGGSPRCLP